MACCVCFGATAPPDDDEVVALLEVVGGNLSPPETITIWAVCWGALAKVVVEDVQSPVLVEGVPVLEFDCVSHVKISLVDH
jgi:hypothetical protein